MDKYDKSIEDDPMFASYFQKRKQIRESLGSANRDSSLGILSVGRMSEMNENLDLPSLRMSFDNGAQPNTDSHVFKVPEVPKSKLMDLDAKLKALEALNPSDQKINAERAKAQEVLARPKVIRENSERASFSGASAGYVLKDFFSKDVSPKTPRVFRDELDSLSLEAPSVSSMTPHKEDRLRPSDNFFPVRSASAANELFKQEQAAFKASTEFHHDSNVSHFSNISDRVENDSIGSFFAKKTVGFDSLVGQTTLKDDSTINSETNSTKTVNATTTKIFSEHSTVTDIRLLLANSQFSNTAVADELLKKLSTHDKSTCSTMSPPTRDIKCLSQSRHSTPLIDPARRTTSHSRVLDHDDATPIKYDGGIVKNRRLLFNSNTLMGSANSGCTQVLSAVSSQQQTSQDASETLTAVNSTIRSDAQEHERQPAGEMDSSVTSLIRREFPSVLLDDEDTKIDSQASILTSGTSLSHNLEQSRWLDIKCPVDVTATVKADTTISVPVQTENRWLKVAIVAVELPIEDSVFRLSQADGAWEKQGLLSLRFKDTALAPLHQHFIEMVITAERELKSTALVKFCVQDMVTRETQEATTLIHLTMSSSNELASVSPREHNFGTLPLGCYLDHKFQLSYPALHETLLMLSIDENQKYFSFPDSIRINGQIVRITWKEGKKKFEVTLKGRDMLEFLVRFHPENIEDIKDSRLVKLKSSVIVTAKTDARDYMPIAQCPIFGEAAYAKFVPDCDLPPMVFRTSPKVPLARSYHLTNVGAVALKLSLSILADRRLGEPDQSRLFAVPNFITIPLNDSANVEVIFSASSRDSFISRCLRMQVEPNGKEYYIDLIGCFIESSDDEGKSTRSSIRSGSTASTATANEPVPVKLESSKNALSWAATPLQEASIQSLDVKLKSQHPATVRIYFANDTGTFKMVNEKCEPESKCRKCLRPNVATTLHILFKPLTIGLQTNLLTIEFNNATKLCQVPLIAYGGSPNLRIEGTDSDVFGNKMLRLSHPGRGSSVYTAQFRITNYGNVDGFVHISALSSVAAHALKIYPLEATIEPNGNVVINVSRHLTRDEVDDITAQSNIKKLATLSVSMGDEPSRQRLRRFFEKNGGSSESAISQYASKFPCERSLELPTFNESKEFEKIFLKSVKTLEVMVVFEKDESNEGELTALDESESFTSLCDTIMVQPTGSRSSSALPSSSTGASAMGTVERRDPSKKIVDWLQTLP